MKKAFYLYQDQKEVIDMLTDTQAGRLFKAIYLYHSGGKPKLDKFLLSVFIPIRQTLDRFNENYTKVSETRRNSANTRWNKAKKNAYAMQKMQMHANAYDRDRDSNILKNIKEKKLVSSYKNVVSENLQGFDSATGAEILSELSKASTNERMKNAR